MVATAARPAPTANQIAARWHRAFTKAFETVPTVRRFAADRWAVDSTRAGITYLVVFGPDGPRCSCPAGDNELPCYHAAACMIHGATTQPEPPPAAPAVAASYDCPHCDGRGYHMREGQLIPGRLTKVNCQECRGRGVKRAA